MIPLVLLLLMLAKQGTGNFSFEFDNFNNARKILLEGDATTRGSDVEMTRLDGELKFSHGRVSFEDPVQLWDPRSRKLTDIFTHFTFSMKNLSNPPADGLAFFLAPFGPEMARDSGGEFLGLLSWPDRGTGEQDNRSFVAVEYDTATNVFDPPGPHVGVDINNVTSVVNATWLSGNVTDGRVVSSWVRYDSATLNLSVYLTYDHNPVFSERYCLLWYELDLRDHLPEKIRVGFTASTGLLFQTNTLHSWSFNSTLELIDNDTGLGFKAKLGIGLGVGFGGAVVSGLGIYLWLKKPREKEEEDDDEFDPEIDGELETGAAGPKRFVYAELWIATRDFAEEGKLGEGGFGCVYKGTLNNGEQLVAVKRISKTSKQGSKEYVSEVKIISRLRHRNLVQLIGWCHKKSEFLLVYEYLPNGSLDSHLFPGGKFKTPLPWVTRQKIAMGLASALLYLHEEWEQCVVHRDIKSSNVMLDSNFNAKLGDFGLARLVDHEYSLYTVAFAGTMGYIAPECIETGKSSKESDVYSFGVVALEICCGRRSVVPNPSEPSRVKLVNWVWELYGKGRLFEAVDERLGGEFEAVEIECLMIVGLWCCHPDPNFRPAMKQVMNVLSFEAPLPNNLPKELPRLMYGVPSFTGIDSYSSSAFTGSSVASSNSAVKSDSKPLLKLEEC